MVTWSNLLPRSYDETGSDSLFIRIHSFTVLSIYIHSFSVCYLAARLKRAKLVVDWHNYSSAMLRAAAEADESTEKVIAAATAVDKAATSPASSSSRHSRAAHNTPHNNPRNNAGATMAMTIGAGSENDESDAAASASFSVVAYLAAKFEGFFGRRADWNFCVSVGWFAFFSGPFFLFSFFYI